MRIIIMSVTLFLFFSGCNSSSNSDASSSQETNQPQTPIEPNNPSPEVPSNPSSSETNPESNETSPSNPSPEDNITSPETNPETNTTSPEENNQTSSLPITIELSLDNLELKEGSSMPLHVKGIDAHTNLKWTISNPQLVSITNNTLNALKEGNVSLSVSTDNAQSNTLHVSIYGSPDIQPISLIQKIKYSNITLEVNATNTEHLFAINETMELEQNKSIQIPGIKNDSLFYIYNLPLIKGDNIIKITATNGPADTTDYVTIFSDANGTAPIFMRSEAFQGVGSLNTPIQAFTPLDVSEYLFDVDGDGIIDTEKDDNNITINLSKEGRYRPKVTVRTVDNVLYSTGDFALSLDVKSDANQTDPKGFEPIDEAKRYMQAIIDDDRNTVERFLGYNERLIGYVYGDPRARPFMAQIYSKITSWEQTYYDSDYASVKILFDIEGKTYGGGFEMVAINPQVNTGREWIIRFFY